MKVILNGIAKIISETNGEELEVKFIDQDDWYGVEATNMLGEIDIFWADPEDVTIVDSSGEVKRVFVEDYEEFSDNYIISRRSN